MECLFHVIGAAAIAAFATYMFMRKPKKINRKGNKTGGGFDEDEERML